MMKKRNGILTGLIAACAACVISAASCLQSPQTSNKPTDETPMATVCVRYMVDNIDEAIEFYTKAFGLRPGRRFDNSVAEMLGASSKIYLLAKPSGSPASTSTPQKRDYRRHWTPVHLDFVVDDINAAVERAKAAGAKLEGDINTYKWGHIAYMSDPFGHGFCLIEFIGRGYDEILG